MTSTMIRDVACAECGDTVPQAFSWMGGSRKCPACLSKMAKVPENRLLVGWMVRATVPLLGNERGAVGYVFNCYQDFDHANALGVQVIFQNGAFDGFSLDEQAMYLEFGGYSIEAQEYEFTSVVKVVSHYRMGIWNFRSALRHFELRDKVDAERKEMALLERHSEPKARAIVAMLWTRYAETRRAAKILQERPELSHDPQFSQDVLTDAMYRAKNAFEIAYRILHDIER